MFTVEVGYDYEGYTLYGVWPAENVARLHARWLRRDERGDYVRIKRWNGKKEELVAEWAFDHHAETGHKAWYLRFEGGTDDPLAFWIEAKPHEYDPAFLEEMA